MNSQPEGWREKLNIGGRLRRGFRLPGYVWLCFVGSLLLAGVTFAWYSQQKREAETEDNNVMKPYYLSLQNPSETDSLRLSVGGLLQGSTKQIVFCVNTKEEQRSNPDKTTFAYELELVHTDNLPLKYEIYELSRQENATGGEEDIIIAEDILTDGENHTAVETTYWKKKETEGVVRSLRGTDVSSVRHAQLGLIASEAEEPGAAYIINRGTYLSYGAEADNNLELTVGGENGDYTSQYFVLEISWKPVGSADYSKYEKETDMIYLLAKVIQPEPEK